MKESNNDKLKRLIIDNPDLTIKFLCSSEIDDDYSYYEQTINHVDVGEWA